MKKAIAIIIEVLLVLGMNSAVGFAQTSSKDSVLTDTLPSYDNLIKATDLSRNKPFPYPKPDAANYRLYAQIWRDIDLADTANSSLKLPGKSLMESIMNGIKAGKLTPYEKEDFKKKLTARQGETRFADSVLIPLFDKDGNQTGSRMALNEFNPDKIQRFRIKEDVYFDRRRGRIDTRIVALAPLMQIRTSAELAESAAATPAFWLYFPQLRYTLVTTEIGHMDDDIYPLTLDDIFMQHRFLARLVRQATPGGLQSGQLVAGSPEAIQFEQKLTSLKKNIWKGPRGIDESKLENEADRQAALSRKEDKHEKGIKNR